MKRREVSTHTDSKIYGEIQRRALYMRQNPTPAESKLWQSLRAQRVSGFRFRRQHPIDRFIVDFYCRKARLVIEVDGPVHDSPQARECDAARQALLEEKGLTLLRFSNDQALYSTGSLINEIVAHLLHTVQPISQNAANQSSP